MKKYLYIILLSLPLLFQGCFSYEEIKVVKVKDVTYQEFRGNVLKLSIKAIINNPNYFNVKITNANMVLRLNDRVLGNIMQVERLEIKGQTEKEYEMFLSIDMKDLTSNMIGIYRVLMNNPKNLNLSGTVEVKSFLYHKTFQVDHLSFQ